MKQNIKIACKKCGYEPQKDKDKSNKNWDVFNLKEPCEKCGGELGTKINGEII